MMAKTTRGNRNEKGIRLLATSNNGYMVAGITNSKGKGGNDIWVLMADQVGNIVWDKTYGSYQNDSVSSLAAIDDSKFILTGSSEDKAFAFVIDKTGNILSENFFGSLVDVEISEVIKTGDNHFLFAGRSTNNGTKDGYLLEVNYNNRGFIKNDVDLNMPTSGSIEKQDKTPPAYKNYPTGIKPWICECKRAVSNRD
ncbi:MAG: hypothetical protein HC896_07440 [Bacteroidales bacterium]|nr:hypothetical protein [Bacteroidales bacterium]